MADETTRKDVPNPEHTAAFPGQDPNNTYPLPTDLATDRAAPYPSTHPVPPDESVTDVSPPTIESYIQAQQSGDQTADLGSATSRPTEEGTARPTEQATLNLPTEDEDEYTPATRAGEHRHQGPKKSPAREGKSGAFWDTVEHSGNFQPGQIIFNRYIVQKKLGQGGMGDVWLVKHKELNVDRALKVIVSRISFDSQARARFKREAQIMASFHHPNAVVVHDARLTEQDVAYIDMEFVQGKPLSEEMRKGEPMPLGWIARILDQLCDVLELAHEKGIVHRDLKPANLMLVEGRDHGREQLKVLDFGIAKVLSDAEVTEAGPHTQTGAFLGTPYYASPEQIEGNVDTRSDIYSVGVLLYEFLTGHRPFTGPAARVFVDVSMTPPPTFAEINAAVEYPPAVEALVMRCLAKKADDRPQTVREVATGFRAALPAETLPPVVKIRYETLPPDPWRWVKLGAAAVVLIVIAALVGSRLGRPKVVESPGNKPGKPTDANTALIPKGFAQAPESKVDVQGRPLVLTATGEAEPLNLRMIVIPGGTFEMGEPGKETGEPGKKTHTETLGDFAIGETEVTNGQMKTYFKARGISTYPIEFQHAIDTLKEQKLSDAEIDTHPAVGISRTAAADFAHWAGGELPTEAQWEYTARSRGLPDRFYVWPDTIPPKKKLKARSGDTNLDNLEGRETATSPVKGYPKDVTNEGIFDMMGNVREWCRDSIDVADVKVFVIRGGSYISPADVYSNFAREMSKAQEMQPDLGFRIVVELPTAPSTKQ